MTTFRERVVDWGSAFSLSARDAGALLDRCFYLYRRNLRASLTLALASAGAQALATLLALAALDTTAFAAGLIVMALLGNAFLSGFALVSPVLFFSAFNWFLSPSEPVGRSQIDMIRLAPFLFIALASVALGLVAMVAEGALTQVYLQRGLGRPADWKDSLRASLRRARALWILSAVRLIPNAAGESAFVIGVYFTASMLMQVIATGWIRPDDLRWPLLFLSAGLGLSVFAGPLLCALPVVLFEQTGALPALRRSFALSRRDAVRLALRLLMLWSARVTVIGLPSFLALMLLPVSLVGRVTEPINLLIWVMLALSAGMSSVIGFPLTSAFAAVNYLDLRARRENFDLVLKAAALSADAAPDSPVASTIHPR